MQGVGFSQKRFSLNLTDVQTHINSEIVKPEFNSETQVNSEIVKPELNSETQGNSDIVKPEINSEAQVDSDTVKPEINSETQVKSDLVNPELTQTRSEDFKPEFNLQTFSDPALSELLATNSNTVINSVTVDRVANSKTISQVTNSEIIPVANSEIVAPVNKSETADPVTSSEKDAVRTNLETVASVANSEIVAQVTNSETFDSVTNSGIVDAVANLDTVDPVTIFNTVNPVVNSETADPVNSSEIVAQITNTETDDLVTNSQTVYAVANSETVDSLANSERVDLVTNSVDPVSILNTVNPLFNLSTGNQKEVKPVSYSENVNPELKQESVKTGEVNQVSSVARVNQLFNSARVIPVRGISGSKMERVSYSGRVNPARVITERVDPNSEFSSPIDSVLTEYTPHQPNPAFLNPQVNPSYRKTFHYRENIPTNIELNSNQWIPLGRRNTHQRYIPQDTKARNPHISNHRNQKYIPLDSNHRNPKYFQHHIQRHHPQQSFYKTQNVPVEPSFRNPKYIPQVSNSKSNHENDTSFLHSNTIGHRNDLEINKTENRNSEIISSDKNKDFRTSFSSVNLEKSPDSSTIIKMLIKNDKPSKSEKGNKSDGTRPNIFPELKDEDGKEIGTETILSDDSIYQEKLSPSEANILQEVVESRFGIKLLSEPNSKPSSRVEQLYSPDRESFVDPLIRTFPQPSSEFNENLPRPVYIPENESFGNKYSDKIHLQPSFHHPELKHYPNPNPEYKPNSKPILAPVRDNALYAEKYPEKVRPSVAPGPTIDSVEETTAYTPFYFYPMQKIRNWFYGAPAPKADQGAKEDLGEAAKEKEEIDKLLNTIDTLSSPENPEGLNQLKNMTDTIIKIIRKDYFQNEFKVRIFSL